MRKLICIVISIVLLLFCAGCQDSPAVTSDTVLFYYIHNELEYGSASGVIVPTAVDAKEYANNYRQLLEIYFRGPTNYDCISPFPAGIALKDFQIVSNKAQILLTPHMTTLSGSSLTVALACLTRTIIEMTGAQSVQIRVEDNQINGTDSLTLTQNSFIYWDDVQSGIVH